MNNSDILILICQISIISLVIRSEQTVETITTDENLDLVDKDLLIDEFAMERDNPKANYVTTLPPDSVCGKTTLKNSTKIQPYIDDLTRIAGGRLAKGGTWPSMCALFSKNSNTYGYICAASIINNRWLVTAANCVATVSKTNLVVLCGRQDIGKWLKDSTFTLGYRSVADLVINPNWDSLTGDNDVALIKVSTVIKFNRFEQPICLANSTVITNATTVWIAGWGLSKSTYQLSKKLIENQIQLVSNVICAALLNSPPIVNSCKVCAGGPGNDTCSGDYGGPLVVRDTSGPISTLHGIITRVGCGTGQPDIQLRVACVRDWIISIIQSH